MPSRMNRSPVATSRASIAYESASTASRIGRDRDVGREARERRARQLRALADGRDRRHARRTQGRREPGEQRDQGPDEQRDDDRPGGEDGLRLRQVEVERDEELVQPDREPEPGEQSDDRREQADHQRLQDHGAQHLPARRADRSQRGELARPLRDRDRERVEDHEGADEQGDAGERQQEVPDDRRERRDLVRVLARLLGSGPHRHGVTELLAGCWRRAPRARPRPPRRPAPRRARPPCRGAPGRSGRRRWRTWRRRASSDRRTSRFRRSRTPGRGRGPRRRSGRRGRGSRRRRPPRRSRAPPSPTASGPRRG